MEKKQTSILLKIVHGSPLCTIKNPTEREKVYRSGIQGWGQLESLWLPFEMDLTSVIIQHPPPPLRSPSKSPLLSFSIPPAVSTTLSLHRTQNQGPRGCWRTLMSVLAQCELHRATSPAWS
jgi:hypothetical protein